MPINTEVSHAVYHKPKRPRCKQQVGLMQSNVHDNYMTNFDSNNRNFCKDTTVHILFLIRKTIDIKTERMFSSSSETLIKTIFDLNLARLKLYINCIF